MTRPAVTRFPAIIAAVIALTVVRVASTYLVFAQTIDEPSHIAAGHQWLTQHRYVLEPEHPPLARVIFALPFMRVAATHPTDQVQYGNDLLEIEDRYIHNLTKARRGNLLFVILTLLFVALAARRLFGEPVAVIALLLFASLPPFLAHAGLATTDVAAAASFVFALYALVLWSEAATWPRTLLLGFAAGVGLISKYSFVPFFGAAAIITLLVRRPRLAIGRLLVAAALAFLIVWSAFCFSVASVRAAHPDAAGIAKFVFGSERIADVPLPAPMFFFGLLRVKHHDMGGHWNYLLGKVSLRGWWYYFPIALAVKTPIPFLFLTVAGSWLLLRRRKTIELVLVAVAILAIAMTSSINIGIRHLLPMYVVLAMIAAYAAVSLWPRSRLLVIACLAWAIIGSLAAHPDYLPWMNAFAGRHPERVLEDSNLDWGQDLWRLVRVLKKRHIDSIGYSVFTNVRPSSVHFTQGYILDPHKPSGGWIVISEYNLQLAVARDPFAYAWLTQPYSFERIGKTIRLYHVPAQ